MLALRAGQIDLAVQLSAQEAAALTGNRFKRYAVPSSAHRMFGLRVDRDPFRDPSVRRAVALTLNRPDLIQRILLGQGTLGNDSPFWSKYPSTDPSISQRRQNLALARALLQAAGRQEPRVHDHHVERHRPSRLRAGDPGGRPPGRYGHQARGAVVRRVLRRRGRLLRDDPVAQPARDDHGVRRSRGSEPVPHERVHDRRNLERVALLEPRVRLGGEVVPRVGRHQVAASGDEEDGGILLRDTPVITSYFISFVTVSAAKVQNYQAEADLARAPRQDVVQLDETRTRAAGGTLRPPATTRA